MTPESFKASYTKLFNSNTGYFKWMRNRTALALVAQPGTPWSVAKDVDYETGGTEYTNPFDDDSTSVVSLPSLPASDSSPDGITEFESRKRLRTEKPKWSAIAARLRRERR